MPVRPTPGRYEPFGLRSICAERRRHGAQWDRARTRVGWRPSVVRRFAPAERFGVAALNVGDGAPMRRQHRRAPFSAASHLVMHSVIKLRRAGPRSPLSLALLQQAACFSGLLTRQHWSEFCPWPQGPMPVPRPAPPPCASAISGVAATRAAARMIADIRYIWTSVDLSGLVPIRRGVCARLHDATLMIAVSLSSAEGAYGHRR